MQEQRCQDHHAVNGAAQPNGTISESNGEAEDCRALENGVLEEGNDKSGRLSTVHQELVRLIGQYLIGLGFKKSADILMDESGCGLDHPAAAKFRQFVMNGEWSKAEATLNDLQGLLDNKDSIQEMRFLLVEQKFLELLEKRDDIGALTCLREQITPLAMNIERVHHLSSMMFISDPEELRKAAGWSGAEENGRKQLMDKLQNYLPPSIMLPPRRLESLIIQAVLYQDMQCPYHNTMLDSKTLGSSGSLLTDHICSKNAFPCHTLQTLSDHCDEVWMARFSPDGLKLATASKDCTVIIWDVNPEELTVSRRTVLEGHSFGVIFIAWSPDSKKLIACVHEEAAELVVWDVEKAEQICKVSNSPDDFLACAAWHKDSKKFACGGTRGQFYLCNLEGQILESWEGVRVQGLAYLPDGKTVLASDTHHRIRAYVLEEGQDHNVLQEDHSIMTFTVDSTGCHALLNVSNQGVHLWDLENKTLVRKYRGLTQGHYTIHSCFGGVNDNFIASGSEDNKVYIWHRNQELPLTVLTGHTRTVNCVTWNPVYPAMLASVSDDSTVQIWGPSPQYRNEKANEGIPSNGIESSRNGFWNGSSTTSPHPSQNGTNILGE